MEGPSGVQKLSGGDEGGFDGNGVLGANGGGGGMMAGDDPTKSDEDSEVSQIYGHSIYTVV